MKTRSSLTGISVIVAALLATASAHAELKTESVTYDVNGESFTGYFAYDDEVSGKRPGILVVHEWWGHNTFARKQAERLADMGYTAFALDMYGSGKVAQHPDDAMAFMKAAMSNPDAVEARFMAAMSVLQKHPTVNPDQIAAQGYCFGGGVVLNMARRGVDLAGVVSFHGSLAAASTAEPGTIKPRIQVYTGGDDSFVPADQVGAFVTEMQTAGAALELVSYPGVKHSFTSPGADALGKQFDMPLAYNAEAAEDSWDRTGRFYDELFGQED